MNPSLNIPDFSLNKKFCEICLEPEGLCNHLDPKTETRLAQEEDGAVENSQ